MITSSPTPNERRQPSPSIGTAGVARPSPVPESRLGTLIRAAFRLRLTNDDGTPTAWWAFLNIVAPSLFVLSFIAVAIFRY